MQDKLKGRKIIAPHDEARPKGANVVDLMEALKRSVGQPGGGKDSGSGSGKSKPPTRGKKRA